MAAGGPDLVFVGQITIDDVVPATPRPWRREIGGSSLYGIAGARLWLDPARIGIVARLGIDYPFNAEAILRRAGIGHIALSRVSVEHLIEWLIYEEDGSRRSLPRNDGLRDVGGEGSATMQPFFDRLLAISPDFEDIPPGWLPAPALHLCPQAGGRHQDTIARLRGKVGRISVDPSPHYSRDLDPAGLAARLEGATAFLPSLQEVRPLADAIGAEAAALALRRAGFPEVVIKRGGEPVIAATDDTAINIAVSPATVIDPTGAGDAFCGAYAACRLLGHSPEESVRNASKSAALVVGCSGAEAALGLSL